MALGFGGNRGDGNRQPRTRSGTTNPKCLAVMGGDPWSIFAVLAPHYRRRTSGNATFQRLGNGSGHSGTVPIPVCLWTGLAGPPIDRGNCRFSPRVHGCVRVGALVAPTPFPRPWRS